MLVGTFKGEIKAVVLFTPSLEGVRVKLVSVLDFEGTGFRSERNEVFPALRK